MTDAELRALIELADWVQVFLCTDPKSKSLEAQACGARLIEQMPNPTTVKAVAEELLKLREAEKWFNLQKDVLHERNKQIRGMQEELLAARALRDEMMVKAGLDWAPDTIIQGRLLAPLLSEYDLIRAKNEGPK